MNVLVSKASLWRAFYIIYAVMVLHNKMRLRIPPLIHEGGVDYQFQMTNFCSGKRNMLRY